MKFGGYDDVNTFEQGMDVNKINTFGSEKNSGEKPKLLEQLIKEAKYGSNETDDIIGYLLILIGALIFVGSTYCMIIAKVFMPYTGNIILDKIKDDEHYIFLLPSMLLIILVFAYWNWVSMKLFRHN